MEDNMVVCCIICLVLILLSVVALVNIKNYPKKKLKLILNFLQPLIVAGMVLCSIVYLTNHSNETQSCKKMIQDLNTSIVKMKNIEQNLSNCKSIKENKQAKHKKVDCNISKVMKKLDHIQKSLQSNTKNIRNITYRQNKIKKSIVKQNKQVQTTNITVSPTNIERRIGD